MVLLFSPVSMAACLSEPVSMYTLQDDEHRRISSVANPDLGTHMPVKLEGRRKPYTPKDTDEVRCEVHGLVTTWGALSPIQQLAVEEGLDTLEGMTCLLAPEYR